MSAAARRAAEQIFSAVISFRAEEKNQIRSAWERAVADCSADLAALGYARAPDAMKLGYLSRFEKWVRTPFQIEHWGLPRVGDDELDRALEAARQSALPSDLDLLPGGNYWRSRRRGRRPSLVSVIDQQEWDRTCRAIASVRTQHEFALAAWAEYMTLNGEPLLKAGRPSKAVFRTRLDMELNRLLSGAKDFGRRILERVIGACAADASHWRLQALRWQLGQATLELQPRGDFLEGKRPPQQLAAYGELQDQLLGCLNSRTSNSKNLCVAAVMNVYAGKGRSDPRTRARNSIERRRQTARKGAARRLTEGGGRKRKSNGSG
jgi:hypothetical protein